MSNLLLVNNQENTLEYFYEQNYKMEFNGT